MPDKEREARQRSAIRLGLEAPEAILAAGTFSRLVDDIERQAAATPWLAGEAFTLADIAIAPYVARLEMLAMQRLWTEGRRPAMARWWVAMKARSCYRAEVQDKFPAASVTVMRERGEAAWPRLAQILGMN
jgi:glutathione S-transferase